MTNKEKAIAAIAALDDEQIAGLIDELELNEIDKLYCKAVSEDRECFRKCPCRDCILDWLKQDAPADPPEGPDNARKGKKRGRKPGMKNRMPDEKKEENASGQNDHAPASMVGVALVEESSNPVVGADRMVRALKNIGTEKRAKTKAEIDRYNQEHAASSVFDWEDRHMPQTSMTSSERQEILAYAEAMFDFKDLHVLPCPEDQLESAEDHRAEYLRKLASLRKREQQGIPTVVNGFRGVPRISEDELTVDIVMPNGASKTFLIASISERDVC